MAVELQLRAGLFFDRGKEARDAPGEGGVRVGHAPTDRVANAELGDAFAEVEDALHEGDHPAEDVGARAVLQVDARDDVVLQRRLDRLEVLLDRVLFALVAELVEDVVVGRGGEHAGLLDPALREFDEQLDVLRRGARPRRDLGPLVVALQQLLDRPGVALLIDEGLDGVDRAGAVIEAMKEIVVLDAGFVREQRHAAVLGAVPERGVGDQLGTVIDGRRNDRLVFHGDGRELAIEVVVDALRVDLQGRYHGTS